MPPLTTNDVDLDLRVDRKEFVADGVVLLSLRDPQGRDLPSWQPGAHVDLVLTDELIRQYSLCGDVTDRSVFQVAVLRDEEGRGGSAHIHDVLAEGDRVRTRGPRNHFRLESARRYLFLAGGIGITPLLPMIAAVAAENADWQLVYGGRSRVSMAFAAQLEESWPEHVSVHPQDEVGLLDLETILASPGRSADDLAVYACGPEGLLAAAERACSGWPRGSLRLERFAPHPGSTSGPQDSFEVQLSRSGTVIKVPAERSLLDVLEDAGLPIVSSCGEGTCGTCEVAVLEGTPEHRDDVLSDEEREANDRMMVCVSRSSSPRLVLDL